MQNSPGYTGSVNNLKPVKRDSVDANLKKFWHNLLQARTKPSLSMGTFRLTELIAIVSESLSKIAKSTYSKSHISAFQDFKFGSCTQLQGTR